MGIQGLLPLLKEIQRPRHISEFAGQTLAVDAYVWLHKGAFGCAEDLVKGNNTTKFIDYALHRTRLLQHHGITPLIVFDGGPLPAKKGTEVDRAARRADNLDKARSLESQGRWKEARDAWTKCVDVTAEMAGGLIKALKAEDIRYIVAPYEADAQLAFLEREGIVDGIITEDSDLLVFGCRNVIYKLDTNGECTSISRTEFGKCRESSFSGWNDTDFRRMAILAGCDYLDSIPGVGLKTAHKMMRKHKTVEKVLLNLRLEGSAVPKDYIEQFRLAELVFLHQRVYDPRRGELVTLLPLPDEGIDEVKGRYIGVHMEPDTAKGVAEGLLHPESLEPLEDLYPNFQPQPGLRRNSTAAVTKPQKGTLESFFARVPKGKENTPPPSTPANALPSLLGPRPRVFLPKPIGTRGSGPSRLAEIGSAASNAEAGPGRASFGESSRMKGTYTMEEGSAATSKFFTWQAVEKMEQVPIETIKTELTWDAGPATAGHQGCSREEAEARNASQPQEEDDAMEPVPPSPQCSSFSPDRGVRSGSNLTSPGHSIPHSQELLDLSSPPIHQNLITPDVVRKRKASASPSPTNNIGKRRRRDRAKDHGENVLAPSTSWQIGEDVRQLMEMDEGDDGPDLRGVFQTEASDPVEDSSRAEDDEMGEVRDQKRGKSTVATEEEKTQEKTAVAMRNVVKGWKEKYGFNQTSKFSSPRMALSRKPLELKSTNASPSITPTLSRSKSAKPQIKPALSSQSRPLHVGISLVNPPELNGFGTPKCRDSRSANTNPVKAFEDLQSSDVATPRRAERGSTLGDGVMVMATQSQVFSSGGSQSGSQKLRRFIYSGEL